MGVIVTFDYAKWIARYPEFAQSGGTQPVTPAQAQAFFDEASLYMRNDGGGPVSSAVTQLLLMNMVTAHVAALNANLANGQPTSPLVGRISNASEGSVSVAVEFSPEVAAQWFNQTKYGAAFWAATKAYRMAVYVPGPRARRIGGYGGYGNGAVPGVGNIFPW
jgi:hypothetical protein